MKTRKTFLLAVLAFGIAGSVQALGEGGAKDLMVVNLDQSQTVRLSVIPVSADGSRGIERSTQYPFYTGEKFVVKIAANYSGQFNVYNITPSGKKVPLPSVNLVGGRDTFYPENPREVLEFFGQKGVEKLVLEMMPQLPTASPQPLPAPTAPAQYGLPDPSAGLPLPLPPAGLPLDSRLTQQFGTVTGKSLAMEGGKDIRIQALATDRATFLVSPPGSTAAVATEITITHQ